MEGKTILLEALRTAGLNVVKTAGKSVYVHPHYLIEIEGPSLFKLLDDGYVVAPFGNATELAAFIAMDISLQP